MENSPFNMMKAFMVLGDLTANNQTLEDRVKYKEKIVFATMKANISGWEIPDHYKSLTDEKKLEMLLKIEEISLT